MNVLLVSQCSKRALAQTRRILDQFAERKGDRTWQTPITAIGLSTLRKLLKQQARKNTAVACHWIRGKNHTELMWIVGDQSRFNSQGTVPTNTTRRDVIRARDEGGWSNLQVIKYAAAIAGLFHDFGKSNLLFQNKINPRKNNKRSFEPIRHEWISFEIFRCFVNGRTDEQWLEHLSKLDESIESDVMALLDTGSIQNCKNPFAGKQVFEGPFTELVSWLILTHHRLPKASRAKDQEVLKGSARNIRSLGEKRLTYKYFNPSWNSPQLCNENWSDKDWRDVWKIPGGTPFRSETWRKKAATLSRRALRDVQFSRITTLEDRFVSHLARLSLMLADHIYSGATPISAWQDSRYKVYANSDRKTGALNQKLDEHNIGVCHNAYLLSSSLPRLRDTLPAVTRLRALKKRVSSPRFSWQNKAYDLARSVADRSESSGFFGVNMASTGCGKTFANARIMYGLSSEQKGCRFSVALGLRTLTMQTGEAFKEKLGLADEDLAVLVGSTAAIHLRRLENGKETHSNEQDSSCSTAERIGSESSESAFDEGQYLTYEGMVEETLFGKWLRQSSEGNPKLQKLISAPVLVSTIDYLMPATESDRGTRQMGAMLRLLSSDLVLDEPDDFGLEDLPALCRLVNWAGVFGSRVLLSSATLPPSLVRALFEAYATGREIYNNNCGQNEGCQPITCAWIDEFRSFSVECNDGTDFTGAHTNFVAKRIKSLTTRKESRRQLGLIEVDRNADAESGLYGGLASLIKSEICGLHNAHHVTHLETGTKVSLGLVRFANINPLVALARALIKAPLPNRYHLHFCVYHSQYPALVRSRIESVLDATLNRKTEKKLWSQPSVIRAIGMAPGEHHVFVVLGTAVTEVGRDHDYDWAIVEPSSMRSLIQLAGRVRRHRTENIYSDNIRVLRKNIRGLKGESPCFVKPGFEDKSGFRLATMDLAELLLPDQYVHISSLPRIAERLELDACHNLVDLEHAHIHARLFGNADYKFNASLWWEGHLNWSYEFQRQTPFRKSDGAQQRYAMLFEEEAFDNGVFHALSATKGEADMPQDKRFKRIEGDMGDRVYPWVPFSNQHVILSDLADQLDLTVRECSRRFMTLELRADQEEWCYADQFGVFTETA